MVNNLYSFVTRIDTLLLENYLYPCANFSHMCHYSVRCYKSDDLLVNYLFQLELFSNYSC